jgi:hypothetical protein
MEGLIKLVVSGLTLVIFFMKRFFQKDFIKIWSKEKGVIFDLLEVLKRSQSPPDEFLIFFQDLRLTELIDIIESFFEQLDIAI